MELGSEPRLAEAWQLLFGICFLEPVPGASFRNPSPEPSAPLVDSFLSTNLAASHLPYTGLPRPGFYRKGCHLVA